MKLNKPAHLLAYLALAGCLSLAACGGGLDMEDCQTEEECAAEDATMVEEKDPEMDPYRNCWREGVDAPTSVRSCEQVTRDLNNPYITK